MTDLTKENEELKKHVCEEWFDDGLGCAICLKILRGVKPEHLAEAAKQTEWHIVELKKELAGLKHDIQAYRGALGYPVPGSHDGRTSDGFYPICGMCDAKGKELAAVRENIKTHDPLVTKTYPDGTSETHPISRVVQLQEMELRAIRQERDAYRAGLEWYADERNWHDSGIAIHKIRQPNTIDGPGETFEEADYGWKAKQALTAYPKQKEKE